jgi:hypothetical protein
MSQQETSTRTINILTSELYKGNLSEAAIHEKLTALKNKIRDEIFSDIDKAISTAKHFSR